MPSMPLEHHQVGISPPKETIHVSIPWSNAYVDGNTTIDFIMNVMMLVETLLHILQQGCSEGTSSFETFNQSIGNISNDINAATKKSQKQKQKESEAKP
jgi:hypothetical protein